MDVRNIRVELKDSLFDPAGYSGDALNKIARVREEAGRRLYQVWIFLDGNDLPYVERVTYRLPASAFPGNSTRQVSRTPTNPTCSLIVWTWGVFEVRAEILDKQGNIFEATHALTFEAQLSQPDIQLHRAVEVSRPSRVEFKRSTSSS